MSKSKSDKITKEKNKEDIIEKSIERLKKLEKENKLSTPTAHTIKEKPKGIFGIFSIKYWKYKMWWNNSQDKIMLVNMELRNGQHDTRIIKTVQQGFKYKGGYYIFDDELKYYNTGEQLWCLDYHQDCVLPIKRDIPVNQIKKALEASNLSEVEYSTNPSVLERFIISKISEGIMKGQQIDEFLKNMKTWVIIIALTGIIHLCLFVFKTGMLKGVKIPGLG